MHMQRDMFCYLKPIVPYTGFRSKMLKSANKTYLIVLCMGRANRDTCQHCICKYCIFIDVMEDGLPEMGLGTSNA